MAILKAFTQLSNIAAHRFSTFPWLFFRPIKMQISAKIKTTFLTIIGKTALNSLMAFVVRLIAFTLFHCFSFGQSEANFSKLIKITFFNNTEQSDGGFGMAHCFSIIRWLFVVDNKVANFSQKMKNWLDQQHGAI